MPSNVLEDNISPRSSEASLNQRNGVNQAIPGEVGTNSSGPALSRTIHPAANALESFELDTPISLARPSTELSPRSASPLASLEPQPSDLDREAFALLLEKKIVFSKGGTKDPQWSTLAILLNRFSDDEMVLNFALAAALTELSWKPDTLQELQRSLAMQARASELYTTGKEMLFCLIGSSAVDEPDHFRVVASFWFWHLQHWRDFDQDRLAHSELSKCMREYYLRHNLVRLLAARELYAGERNSRMACMARLTTWLFWADVPACFQGHGGAFSKLLLESPLDALSRIYSRGKSTQRSNFPRYPAEQIRDDDHNERTFELLHDVWVLNQIITDVLDSGTMLSPDQVVELGNRIKELLLGRNANTVALAESPDAVRDRHLGNADWAVASLYALCIYLFRCTLDSGPDALAVLPPEVSAIARDTSGLLWIMDRSIKRGPEGQSERFQWPIFWAGIESFEKCSWLQRDWVQGKLTSPSLLATFQVIQEEQLATGLRAGIGRVREVCREPWGGVL
ncbi:hypothetical protein NEMBOFW57_008554 [Staphylotrichum longicolle]|uniref:Uncharacterized protein n=1 Tax=Staphylotrichum longicolle TaxID=669026 RepID=A0AAD4HVY4_9PEZI|nr:hypothetical protein NEMBOFW57_008554 [Staphylotrichum longicolle]